MEGGNKMKNLTTEHYIKIFYLSLILLLALGYYFKYSNEPPHDHRTYTMIWGNGNRTTLVTVCFEKDTTVVSSEGKHWDFLPKRVEGIISEENRVK